MANVSRASRESKVSTGALACAEIQITQGVREPADDAAAECTCVASSAKKTSTSKMQLNASQACRLSFSNLYPWINLLSRLECSQYNIVQPWQQVTYRSLLNL